MSHFAERLREVINQHCRENASNTPDFILSEYLFRCLDAFDAAVRERDHWHHLHPMPWTTRVLGERPLDTMDVVLSAGELEELHGALGRAILVVEKLNNTRKPKLKS